MIENWHDIQTRLGLLMVSESQWVAVAEADYSRGRAADEWETLIDVLAQAFALVGTEEADARLRVERMGNGARFALILSGIEAWGLDMGPYDSEDGAVRFWRKVDAERIFVLFLRTQRKELRVCVGLGEGNPGPVVYTHVAVGPCRRINIVGQG